MVVSALPTVDAFVAGLVDYAGLFPPAGLDMQSAVNNYSAYRSEPHARILGRFVVPVARLHEFFDAGTGALPRRRDDPPWRLAALGGPVIARDLEIIAQLNALPKRLDDSKNVDGEANTPPVRAIVDTLEVKAATVVEIEALRAAVPREIAVCIEVPLHPDPTPLLEALARVGAWAKIRTGGVSADAIPAPGVVAAFLVAVARARLPFKATAGLHHAIRGRHPLTYEPQSPEAIMHGFVNVFAGAALARAGGSLDEVAALLEEVDAAAFRFGPAGLRWRDRQLSLAQLSDAREHFARSFGSCSFREPLADLQTLGLV